MNTLWLKRVDRCIGRLAVGLLCSGKNRRTMVPDPKTALLIRPGGLGDAILTLPLIKFLQKNGLSRIDVLCETRNCAAYRLIKLNGKVFRYDSLKFAPLFSQTYDIVIDTEQFHRLSAVTARLLRSGFRTGFATNERARCFDLRISYSHKDYEVDSFLRLVEPIFRPSKAELEAIKTPPFVDIEVLPIGWAREALSRLERPIVGIFDGGTVPHRIWPYRKVVRLIEKLISEDISVVLIGGRSELPLSDYLQSTGKFSKERFADFIGKTSILETTAIFSQLDLLVSTDSGILHLGYAVGTPTVSLFGPGIVEKWAPKGARHVVIQKGLPCSPCTRFGYTPPCPFNFRCMTEIEVDEVVSATMSLISLRV